MSSLKSSLKTSARELGRLVFTRWPARSLPAVRQCEAEIRIGEAVVRIESFQGQRVRVVVEAPTHVPVFRGELKVRSDESVQTEANPPAIPAA